MAFWDSRSYKADLEERAYRNEKYLWGKQWYWWDDTKMELVPRTDVAGWRTRLVFNETLTTVENRTSKLMRANASWSPVLENDDEISKVRQRLQSQVMSYQWTDGIRMPAKMRLAAQWAMSSPVVFGRAFWNKKKGPRITARLNDFRSRATQTKVQHPAAQQDLIREADNRFFQLFGQEAYQKGETSFPAGDVDIAVHPIFEVCWWPFEPTGWDKVRLWMWTTKKTVEEVAEEYGLKQEEVREFSVPGYAAGSASFGHANTKWGDKYFWRDGADYALEDDSVLCHHIYKPPNDQFPNGRLGVIIGMGGHCVYLDDMPYPTATPLVPLVEKPIRGSAPGTCVVDQVVHAQDELNMAVSQIADYRNKRIMPTLVDFVGNESHNKKALSNAPGRIYRTTSPDKIPTAIQMPDIGMDYFRSMETARLYMERIGGIASIDTGSGDDANVRSGRAILALREQNDLRLAPFGAALDEFVEELGNQVLDLVVRNTNDKRLVQLIGEGNRLEVVSYRGSDLKSELQNGMARQIRCRGYSTIPQSPTEMLNAINVMGNQGMLEMQDRTAIVEMLGLNDFRRFFDKTRADSARQQSECEKWETGQLVGPPDESDNDAAHLQIIDKWRKGEMYQRMKQIAVVDQMAAQIVADADEHRNQHMASMARKISEEKYHMLDADLSMWMKHRSQWMLRIAQGMVDPQTAMLIMAFYAMPIIGNGEQQGGQEGGEKEGDDRNGKSPDDKTKDPKKPKSEANKKKDGRMPNGTSPNQGVSKSKK